MRHGIHTLAQTARFGKVGRLQPESGRLKHLENFGSNPGALLARFHIPDDLPRGAPLVVVLHGCTQNAGGYNECSGWSDLADTHGFALLFPEQQRANNFNLCFNWFEPGDARRDGGEPLSIVQMIDALAARHGLDRERIFVTGLSAGGAMTAVMLATYPEIFAGGAIIAGLPFGGASSVAEGLRLMQGPARQDSVDLARRVRAASSHKAPWPTLSVWHGTADRVVAASNMTAIVETWLEVQGLRGAIAAREMVDGHERKVWRDASGRDVVESYTIAGMGHGVPLATMGGDGCGVAGPHMLEAGICSTRHIARFWGILTDGAADRVKPLRADRAPEPEPEPEPELAAVWPAATAESGIAKIINDALRASLPSRFRDPF